MRHFACLRSGLLVGAAVWLLAAGALTGCGSSGPSGTSGGTGGSSGSGGSTGSGGSMVDCSGTNDATATLTGSCAISGCHSSSSARSLGAGLDLTPDAGIKSRLVGVMSSGTALSVCGGNATPYLVAGSNPATGLFVDKLGKSPPCGVQMPQIGSITATQVQCLKQWATTLTTGG